jgi:hypothetical protein
MTNLPLFAFLLLSRRCRGRKVSPIIVACWLGPAQTIGCFCCGVRFCCSFRLFFFLLLALGLFFGFFRQTFFFLLGYTLFFFLG